MISLIRTTAKAIFPKTMQPSVTRLFFSGMGMFFRGTRVHCPICDQSYSRFLTFKTRQNAQCPGCSSLERHRLLWLFIEQETHLLDAPVRLLQFAPEFYLQDKFRAATNITHTSTDLSSPLADIHTDIEDMAMFENETFDYVICSHVLDHVSNDRRAISELYRVLKQSGTLIVQSHVDANRERTWEDQSATTPAAKLEIFGQDDLARRYGSDILSRFEAEGFTATRRLYGEELGRQKSTYYGFPNHLAIYTCIKS